MADQRLSLNAGTSEITDHFFALANPPEISTRLSKRMQLKNYLLKHPKIAKEIGLPVFEIPEDTHGVGAKRNIGDLHNADLFAESINSHAVYIDGARILDFGCSTGRLTRVLASYY